MQETVGNQLVMNYIWIQQGTVAQWVELQTLFEMCAGEKGYGRGGLRRDAWWRQEAVETHLRTTLDEILEEARKRK